MICWEEYPLMMGVMMWKANGGFTLIEVMVAVAVVGIAVPALLFSVIQQLDGTGYMRDKLIAQWVATNKLQETQIASARNGYVLTGSSSGEDLMAGRSWYWTIESKKTQADGFLQINISVSDAEESDPVFTLVSYLDSFYQGN